MMNKEQAVSYLRFSGFSDEQIKAIEGAFSCPSAGVDCEDCPAYEPKVLNKWIGAEVLDRIRNEIEQTEINGHIRDVECFRAGIDVALNVIDKYKAEGSEKE